MADLGPRAATERAMSGIFTALGMRADAGEESAEVKLADAGSRRGTTSLVLGVGVLASRIGPCLLTS